jgi:3',5'-cyclic AMP phosphodiesterase CpdA
MRVMTMISSADTTPCRNGNNSGRRSAAGKKFVLAHLSDPHLALVSPIKIRDLLNKRLLGYLKWRLLRQKTHQEEILSLLLEDLKSASPDQIAVTGDLTHLGLPGEFEKARRWLQSLGTPASVTVVPGNHDSYVRSDWNETFARWLEYMVSDQPFRSGKGVSGFEDLFPTVRVRGPVALIGVCSAHPSAPHLAIGVMGTSQLNRLEMVLHHTAAQGLFRIVAIHHPPLPGMESGRRSLTDAHSLSKLVERCGAELIIHGHVHQAVLQTIDTLSGRTPVAGATSASSANSDEKRRACYYLHTLSALENTWDLQIARRVYCPDAHRFIAGEEQHYRLPIQQTKPTQSSL